VDLRSHHIHQAPHDKGKADNQKVLCDAIAKRIQCGYESVTANLLDLLACKASHSHELLVS